MKQKQIEKIDLIKVQAQQREVSRIIGFLTLELKKLEATEAYLIDEVNKLKK